MSTTDLSLPERGAEDRSQEIRQSLRRIEQRDWWLWGYAVLVIFSLTTAVVALSVSVLTKPAEPFYQFHISQSVRGLVGIVLLFNIYSIYQQIQLKRLRAQLKRQIEFAAEQYTRAEEFLKLAMLDPLTGLHNRRFAEERLTAESARAQRHSHSLTVLMLDLDDFKQLNDRYGHFAGDLALKEFAHRLGKAIRGSDLAVRIGGDEFMVILPECQFGQTPRFTSTSITRTSLSPCSRLRQDHAALPLSGKSLGASAAIGRMARSTGRFQNFAVRHASRLPIGAQDLPEGFLFGRVFFNSECQLKKIVVELNHRRYYSPI